MCSTRFNGLVPHLGRPVRVVIVPVHTSDLCAQPGRRAAMPTFAGTWLVIHGLGRSRRRARTATAQIGSTPNRPMGVDERHYRFDWRSSSAPKKADYRLQYLVRSAQLTVLAFELFDPSTLQCRHANGRVPPSISAPSRLSTSLRSGSYITHLVVNRPWVPWPRGEHMVPFLWTYRMAGLPGPQERWRTFRIGPSFRIAGSPRSHSDDTHYAHSHG